MREFGLAVGVYEYMWRVFLDKEEEEGEEGEEGEG